MKFTVAAVLAAATGAAAWGSNVTVTTEVVDRYTTYCPGATQITHGSHTYTVTEATTLTITDCPCTITRPVVTSSVVACNTCGVPPAQNATWTTQPGVPATTAPGVPSNPTGGVPPPASTPSTAGAGQAAVLSGGVLAGLVGIAAFVL